MLKKLFVFMMLIVVAAPAVAQRDGFMVDSPKIIGMGGAGVAVQGVDNAFFLNPALLASRRRTQFRLVDVRASVNSNAFSQYGFYQDHQDDFDDFPEDDFGGGRRRPRRR